MGRALVVYWPGLLVYGSGVNCAWVGRELCMCQNSLCMGHALVVYGPGIGCVWVGRLP